MKLTDLHMRDGFILVETADEHPDVPAGLLLGSLPHNKANVFLYLASSIWAQINLEDGDTSKLYHIIRAGDIGVSLSVDGRKALGR